MLPIRGKKKPADMVKAPRSKGCRVCVQRRIKCDLTKPHCLRCQRANRECPGFETTKFVDEGPTLKAFYQTPVQDQSDASRSSSSSPKRDPTEKKSTTESSKLPQKRPRRTSFAPIDAENWTSGVFETTAMINIICPTAYQNQLLSEFISAVRQPVQAPTYRCHSMWLRDVALAANQSPCLIWAIRAISIAHLGRTTRDPNLIETSRRVYGKALIKLNAALQDSVEGLSTNTLSATMILSFYEVFNCTDRNSWIKHAGGAGHLIRLRGPQRHRYGTERTMFMAARYSLIMESFQTRTPCFLDTPEWRALGWQIHEDLKREHLSAPFLDANEHFFQEFVSHPRYLRDAVDAVADPQPKISSLQSLLDSGHAHRTNYQAIHARLAGDLRSQGGEPTRTASSFNDTVFPVVYDYRDIHIASLYVGYWACLCAINITLIGLQAKLAKAVQDQGQREQEYISDPIASSSLRSQQQRGALPERGRPLWDAATSYSVASSNHTHLYIAENATYAREICKSVESLQSTPFIGPLFLVLSLRMALRMGISRREKQWILDKLDTIGDQMGIAKTEVEVYWNQRSAAEAQGKAKGMMPETGLAQGMATYVEKDVLGRKVGSGVEMPDVGVVGFGDDEEDVNEGGLDPAGPPGVESVTTKDWSRVVIDPSLLSSQTGGAAPTSTTSLGRGKAKSVGGSGGRLPANLEHTKGLMSEMAGTQTPNEAFLTASGLGVEWEDDVSLWSQDSERGVDG